MRKYMKKQIPHYLCHCGAAVLLLLSVLWVDHLARSAVVCSDISEALRGENKEIIQLFLGQNNSPVRTFRSNHQRNGTAGRLFNTRSGGPDGGSAAFCEDIKLFHDPVPSKGFCASSVKEHDFLNHFIISALPVRAGPAHC